MDQTQEAINSLRQNFIDEHKEMCAEHERRMFHLRAIVEVMNKNLFLTEPLTVEALIQSMNKLKTYMNAASDYPCDNRLEVQEISFMYVYAIRGYQQIAMDLLAREQAKRNEELGVIIKKIEGLRLAEQSTTGSIQPSV